jgi:peptidoglycan/xylan/chitin deacetylase (PgdA/CDA1 family)
VIENAVTPPILIRKAESHSSGFQGKSYKSKLSIEKTPFISVIVPAFNEEGNISSCIDALQSQKYGGDYEIIVVDNASSDNTPIIASSKGVRVVSEPAKGYSRALIRGFAAARGDIFASTDADSLVPSNWLTKIVDHLSKENNVAVTGVFSFYDGPLPLRLLGGLFGKLNWQLAGANMAVWAWAYRKAGGFSLAINMGADKELGLRLSRIGKVVIDRGLVVATSARRFEAEFVKTLWTYFGNDLCLILFRKPAFFNFDDIRLPSNGSLVRRPVFQLSALLLLFTSFLWYSEGTNNQLFGSVFAHGPKTKRAVALTFDDGPGPQTQALLDTLDNYHVKATFFMIGENVDRYADIAREIARRGHEIGNHTYSHPLYNAIETPQQISSEVTKGALSIERAIGRRPNLFRPPCGWRSPWMMKTVHQLGYSVVTWSVDPNDWKHPPAAIIEKNVVKSVRPGSIVLLHDGLRTTDKPDISATVSAVAVIIRELKAKGFEFTTVSALKDAGGDIYATAVGRSGSNSTAAR